MKAQPRSLRVRLPALLLSLEVLFLALYVCFVAYDDDLDGRLQHNRTVPAQNSLYLNYLFFTDVQVMIFVGFGCLLSFLRLYGFSGLAFNFLTATVSIQWAVLVQGYFQFCRGGKIRLSVVNLLNAEFACAVVLISFGAVLGKTSPVQLLVMALLEVPAFAVTEWAVLSYLRINDAGGSILIHLFACYFGLGATFALYRPGLRDGHAKESSNYQSDVLSMLGTLFLWVFWPSFNGALALRGDDQHRAVLHTFLGLSASTLTAFALSAAFERRGRLSMADLQNVTLAGGVTVGASVDMMISPAAAFALGAAGGVACMLGYRHLTPYLARRFRIQDQCGIHNLHGLTGLIASLAGICAILGASEDTYGPSLYQTFSHRAPPEGHALAELRRAVPDLQAGLGRSAREQALWQAAAIGVAVATASVGGVLTGLVMRLPFLAPPPDEGCYDDEMYFLVPSDYGGDGGSRLAVGERDDSKA
ncbi:ammonium transporter Rh type A-like [Conger conger]|uniref:ammonium transporter Rh type A-like n=1 Tax=Conger conger TaxID=82655 RepID=UPI002A5AEC7A|nr:ammonium transporter Rh type A-like [Conger conger]